MFENVGGKIKVFASIICWFGIIASVIIGIIILLNSEVDTSSLSVREQIQYSYSIEKTEKNNVIFGLIWIFGGSLISLVGSFFTYGFGELIETNYKILQKLTNVPTQSNNSISQSNNNNNTHFWKCDKCNQTISEYPCKYCGYSSDVEDEKRKLNALFEKGLISKEEYIKKMFQLF